MHDQLLINFLALITIAIAGNSENVTYSKL